MEHASKVSNRGSQETFTSKHSTMTKLRSPQHLQQDDVAKEEDVAMRSFIMHRFLPAAKEVAAKHESFIAFHASKNKSEAPSPSLPKQSRRTPKPHCIKSRAQQAPKGVTTPRPLHSRHQEDSMPPSMSSCGFFCQGLKTVLFCSHHTVSASGRSTFRKKIPHPSNHLKVADGGISLISSEMEGSVARKKKAMRGMPKHQSGINVDVPILHPLRSPNSADGQEIPWKCADAIFSRRGRPSSDGYTNGGCNPPLSQSRKINLTGIRFENMKSTQSHRDVLVSARNFASMALKEQDIETVQEGPHDLAGENKSRNTLGGLETNSSKAAHDYALRSAWQDGDDDEDDETQFCDGPSSVKSYAMSNPTFYTFDSSGSDCEVLGLKGDASSNFIDESDFTDASSNFETPCASTSENKAVLSDVCVADEKGTSLSQRDGKGLKLETERKEATSPSKHDPSAYKQKHEPQQQAQLQTRRFSKLRHGSLDSLSGLYLSKASAISPVFPAKCQKDTPNGSGWPSGISSYQSNKVGGSPYHIQQEKSSIEKCVIFPPLPPSPTEPWLGKAVTKNTSKPSQLATLQQIERRKSADFISVNPDTERRWEDVVKGSQVHRGHLRYSEELEILMLTSL